VHLAVVDVTARAQEIVSERLEKSATEVDEEMQPIDPTELVRKEWDQAMEPHEDLVLPILPYQKEGLGWMYNQVIGLWMRLSHK